MPGPGLIRILSVLAAVLVIGSVGCARAVDAQPAAPAASVTPGAPPEPAASADPGTPAPPAPPGVVREHWEGCETTGAFHLPSEVKAPSGIGSVPADFTATQAILCELGERTSAAGDRVGVELERRASHIAPLLMYLAKPSRVAKDPATLACAAIGWVRPSLFVLDAAGRWLAPQIPTDVCGGPLGQFDDRPLPYDTLDYRDTVIRQTGIHESAAARRAGCGMQWKNMVSVSGKSQSVSPGRVESDPLGVKRVRSCVYTVPPAEVASETPGGTFVRGGVLRADQRRKLRDALVGSPAAGPCSSQAREFAVVQPLDQGSVVYVELDGCRRILVESTDRDRLAQATPALIRLLSH